MQAGEVQAWQALLLTYTCPNFLPRAQHNHGSLSTPVLKPASPSHPPSPATFFSPPTSHTRFTHSHVHSFAAPDLPRSRHRHRHRISPINTQIKSSHAYRHPADCNGFCRRRRYGAVLWRLRREVRRGLQLVHDGMTRRLPRSWQSAHSDPVRRGARAIRHASTLVSVTLVR